MCFPVSFAKILRTSFFIEHLQWLLLQHETSLLKQIIELIKSDIANVKGKP